MDLRGKTREVLGDSDSLDGMRRAFGEILTRQRVNALRFPDLDARKDRLRAVKERCVNNQELLERAIERLGENGFRVVMAGTADAAVRAIKEEIGDARLVVKSKSNMTKELHLSERLAEEGVEVVETDLGDRIVQLAGCIPVHPTGPACHMTRIEISKLLSEHFGREVSPDPSELTSQLRDEIASYLDCAEVGITGTNAIAAAEGAVVIVHNEGNAARCAMVPGKHIVVATPDKVVPDLDEAISVTKLQTYLSTGKIISSYVNIITGPSYTADIEKKVYWGMHGPKEVVIVFVDDGRTTADDVEPQYCIGCGMCLLHCPPYLAVGPIFGIAGRMGGQGVYLSGTLGKIDEAVEGGLFLCASCGACLEVCPSRIDTKKGIIRTRATAGLDNKGKEQEHDAILCSLRNYDNPWQVGRSRKAKWAENFSLPRAGEVLYFAGCSTSLLFPDTGASVVEIMRACGIVPAHLGSDEPCCGSTARKLGDNSLSAEKARACFEAFERASAKLVVTSCPGCTSALLTDESLIQGYGISVKHVTEFLADRIDDIPLTPVDGLGKVVYHDPCDLGRERGILAEPRKVLARVVSGPLTEFERSGRLSSCCGAGSGLKSAYPELSQTIARHRISMAEAVEADTIVTSCPWCVQNLRDCQGPRPAVEVLDLVDIVARSLSV